MPMLKCKLCIATMCVLKMEFLCTSRALMVLIIGDENGSWNTTIIIIIVTGVITALLIAIVIMAIGIMRQKFALPTPDPIYDDPDNPYYSSVLDKTEKAASNEISLQTQPEESKYVTRTNQQKNVAPSIEQQDNVAYGALSNQQQQLPGDQAEEQC